MNAMIQTVKTFCCSAILYGIVDGITPKKGVYTALRVFMILYFIVLVMSGLSGARTDEISAILSAEYATVTAEKEMQQQARDSDLLILKTVIDRQLIQGNRKLHVKQIDLTGNEANRLEITLDGTVSTQEQQVVTQELQEYLGRKVTVYFTEPFARETGFS